MPRRGTGGLPLAAGPTILAAGSPVRAAPDGESGQPPRTRRAHLRLGAPADRIPGWPHFIFRTALYPVGRGKGVRKCPSLL